MVGTQRTISLACFPLLHPLKCFVVSVCSVDIDTSSSIDEGSHTLFFPSSVPVAPSNPEHLTMPGATEQNDDPDSPTNGSSTPDIRPRGGLGVSPVDVFQDQFKPSQYTRSHSFTNDWEKQPYPVIRPSVEGRRQRPYPAPSGFAEVRMGYSGDWSLAPVPGARVSALTCKDATMLC